MNWSVADFVIFGAMVVGVGVAFQLAARRTGNKTYRAAVGVALAAAFLLIWANGAVGVIGSEDHPANRLIHGVLAVGIAGAAIARLRPRGMARAMVATAVAQVLVAVIAWWAGWGSAFLPTLFFGSFWLVSAGLFRKVARHGG